MLDRLWTGVAARDVAPDSGTATYRVGRGAEDVSWAHGNRRRTAFAARFLVSGSRGTLVLILARKPWARGRRAASELRREVAAAVDPRSGEFRRGRRGS